MRDMEVVLCLFVYQSTCLEVGLNSLKSSSSPTLRSFPCAALLCCSVENLWTSQSGASSGYGTCVLAKCGVHVVMEIRTMPAEEKVKQGIMKELMQKLMLWN